jgi:hypothetical protein
LFEKFRAWLLMHNQANGHFYRSLPAYDNHSGVDWPPSFPLPTHEPKPGTLTPAIAFTPIKFESETA